MVLVPVCNHESLYLIRMLLQISNIRNHQVDAQHLIFRNRQATIYHNNTVLILEGSNIKPNLLQAPQRNHLQPGSSFSLFNFFQIYFLHSLIHTVRNSTLTMPRIPSPNRKSNLLPNNKSVQQYVFCTINFLEHMKEEDIVPNICSPLYVPKHCSFTAGKAHDPSNVNHQIINVL